MNGFAATAVFAAMGLSCGLLAQRTAPLHSPGASAARPVAITSGDMAALGKALAAYDAGQTAAAKPELERLATKYPGNFPSNEAIGILYLEAGNALAALPFLEHAAAAEPRNAAAQANLGAAYLAAGISEKAVRVLERASALDANNAQTWSSLGRARFAAKQLSGAVDAFARAAKLDPTNTDDAYNWAVALYGLRRDTEAAEVLARVPTMQRTEGVESLWGDVEERRGHPKEAVEHLQAAARLNPSEPNTYAVAIELLRHWSWAQAAEITAFGVRSFPESRRMLMADGIAAYGGGKYPEAAAVFGRLLALEPANETYGSLLGRSCAAAGGAQAPECASLVAFAERQPGNAQIDVSAAVSLLHESGGDAAADQEARLVRADHLLQAAIARDPKLPEAWYQRGVLEQQRQQWKESAASLEQAIGLRPAFAEAHYRLSRAYSHLGQVEQAKAEIALQQRYAQQEKDETNAKLKEVTVFLVESH